MSKHTIKSRVTKHFSFASLIFKEMLVYASKYTAKVKTKSWAHSKTGNHRRELRERKPVQWSHCLCKQLISQAFNLNNVISLIKSFSFKWVEYFIDTYWTIKWHYYICDHLLLQLLPLLHFVSNCYYTCDLYYIWDRLLLLLWPLLHLWRIITFVPSTAVKATLFPNILNAIRKFARVSKFRSFHETKQTQNEVERFFRFVFRNMIGPLPNPNVSFSARLRSPSSTTPAFLTRRILPNPLPGSQFSFRVRSRLISAWKQNVAN